jgi:hypothetical protein
VKPPKLTTMRIVDTVDAILRQRISELARRDGQQMTFDQLLALAHRVAGDDHGGWRFGVINKAFDGIETRDGNRWAA